MNRSQNCFVALTRFACLPGRFCQPACIYGNGANITAFEGDVESEKYRRNSSPERVDLHIRQYDQRQCRARWLFDRHNVLTGVVINSKLVTEGSSSVITGLAYFTKGEWLTNLGRNQASEIVTLNDGMALSGHIGGANSTALDMVLADGTRRSVNFSDIAAIQSPRAYPFRNSRQLSQN